MQMSRWAHCQRQVAFFLSRVLTKDQEVPLLGETPLLENLRYLPIRYNSSAFMAALTGLFANFGVCGALA